MAISDATRAGYVWVDDMTGADDTEKIKNAIDSLPDDGGVVQLGARTYTVTPRYSVDGEPADSAVVLRTGVILQGLGSNATRIYMAGASGKLISTSKRTPGTNDNHIAIRDLQVYGDYLPDTTSTKPDTYGLFLSRVSHAQVENVEVGGDFSGSAGGFGVGIYQGPDNSGYHTYMKNRIIRCHWGIALAYNAAWVICNDIAAKEYGVVIDESINQQTGDSSAAADNVILSNYFESTLGVFQVGVRDMGSGNVVSYNRFDGFTEYAWWTSDEASGAAAGRGIQYGNKVLSGNDTGAAILSQETYKMRGTANWVSNGSRTITHNRGDISYGVIITPLSSSVSAPWYVTRSADSFTVHLDGTAPSGSYFYWQIVDL